MTAAAAAAAVGYAAVLFQRLTSLRYHCCYAAVWIAVALSANPACGIILSEHTGPIPEFSNEPPAEFLAISGGPEASNQLSCSLKSGAHSDGIQLRWLYEEYIVNSTSGQTVLASLDTPVANSTAVPFVDLGNGRLQVSQSGNGDKFLLPEVAGQSGRRGHRYRVYCQAKDVRTGYVSLSRKTILRKVSNLRQCRAVLNCFSGVDGGTAVCRVQTDPVSLEAFFRVEFYRQSLPAVDPAAGDPSSLQLLRYDPHNPKYGIFPSELHIMRLTAEDTRYAYRARIILLSLSPDNAGSALAYSNLSDSSVIRLLPQGASHHGDAIRSVSNAASLVATEYRDNRHSDNISLPCFSQISGSYSWTKDGEPLLIGSDIVNSKVAYLLPGSQPGHPGSIGLKLTGRQDAGDYRCYINDGSRQLAVYRTQVRVYKQLSVRILIGTADDSEVGGKAASKVARFEFGSEATLKCIADGWPLHRIRWFRNGRRLEHGQDSGSVRMEPAEAEVAAENGWSQLTVDDFRLEDRGAYQCVAERLLETRPAPPDYAVSTVAVLVGDMPPVLIATEPSIGYAPVSVAASNDALHGYYPPRVASTVGTFTCLFMAQPRPSVRAYLDGNQSLFESLSNGAMGQSSPYRLTTHVTGQEVRLVLDYAPTTLQHTGRLLIEATNERGSASCRLVLFGVSSPPKLQIRTMRRRHYAVMSKAFSLECPVLGGLNSQENYPNMTGIETYSVRWLFKPADSPAKQLVLPINHRTITGPTGYPDQLHTIDVEPSDAGQYECVVTATDEAQLDRSGTSDSVGQLKATTDVLVVRGVRPNWISDQLDLDPSISITDSCKPVNTPTGNWFAWWHKADSTADRQELDGEFVTYNPKQGGLAESLEVGLTMAQHSECFARMRDQFADAGFPNLIYSLSDRSLQRRAATLNIRKPQRGRDEGVFVCHIVSCFDHAVAKKRVTLRRDFAFKKDQPPNTQEVALGQPIFVSCAVSDTGLSSPQLVWYEGNSMKEESRVPMYNASGPARVSQFPNATLRISAVSLDDRSFLCAGFYRSVARSTTFNPVIRLPARVLPFDGEPRLEVTAGSTVSIPCRAKGELPMTFQWFAAYQAGGHSLCRVDGDCRQVGIYTEDQDLGNGNSGFGASIGLSGFGSQTLELRRANAGLSGRYTCRASNQYNIFNSRGTGGYSERSIDIVVVSPPGPVRSFQPTDAGADWATLQWEPPPRNGHKPVTAYKVVYTDESASDPGFSIASQETVAATTAGDARSLTVRGLRPGRQLVFRISAVNSVGEGPAVSARVATLEKPPAGPVRNLRVSATPVELSPIEDAQSRDGGVKLVLNWDPPDAQLMNGRLTNYTVHYRRLELGELPADCPPGLAGDSGGGSSTSRFLLATKTPALTAVIGGGFGRDRLRTMSDYQLRVIPANAVGEGPPACAVARTLGSAPMSPPSEVRCQAEGEDRVRVTWTEPPQKSLNGRLVAYQLQYMQAADLVGQDESSAVEVEISGQQRHHVILGLSPFTNYSVSVSVSNSKGRSPLSRPAAFCRTHSSAPIPPADIRPFGANSSAVALAWRQTDRPNGELLRYDLQARCDGGLSDAGNFSKLMPVAPPHRTMVLINGIQVGALCRFRVRAVNTQLIGDFGPWVLFTPTEGTQPLRVASLPSASRVARGSSLTLDCSIVGDGSHEAQWQGPPVDSSKKQVLSNGSLLIESAQSSGQYSCVTADSSDHISHSVEVFTTPSPPQLLPGRVTLTSLEILWRLSGTQAGPAASVATREGARLTELELRYTNLHNGETESRTLDLHPGNRSHLLDPVACGSAVEFRARVVNAFGLRSAFAGPLRMRAPGAAPSPAVSAVTGSGLVVRETALGDVVLNLTAAFLPGLGCPAERFFVYATGRSSDASIVAAVFDGDNGSGSSLRLTAGRLLSLAHNLRLPLTRQSRLRLRVVAGNAAGNSTTPALLDVALPPAPPPVAAWPSSGDAAAVAMLAPTGKSRRLS
ncbi:hypothetical protein BOX15_Mlig006365g2 [Macrostomum lignano]|uniref:Uncharacterized protein n=1 Tax=Macrostomum lignano TaxID=282301 RepID=A0A267DET6_9PLAT|nr:hypothetical protein BOX15_Mlig006365g2 [Macrostomum lignano]